MVCARGYKSVSFNPYLYGSKEYLTTASANLLDFSARTYDPAAILFHTQDPKATSFSSHNTYSYCLDDPINFVDKDGKMPSPKESLLLSKHVYGGTDAEEVESDLTKAKWRVSEFNTSITKNDKFGLNSELYEREKEDGTMEYAYVFAGTASASDIREDVLQLKGFSIQYINAIKNAKTLVKELKNAGIKFELVFIGHSLGGGEATAASMATGHPAITFNPAGLSILTRLFNGLKHGGNVSNYITLGKKLFWRLYIGGDPLHNAQMKFGLSPVGKILYVKTNSMKLSHGIDNFFEKDLPEYE